MEKYLNMLISGGANLAVKINADTIVTAAWTIYKCRYGCSTYGKSHCCPPNAPTWQETGEMIACYGYGILFRCNTMEPVRKLALDVSRILFLDDFYKVIAFASGPCKKCKQCNEDFCLFPGKTVPAMEACGIDVYATVRNNNIEIHTLKSKTDLQSHFGLILVE